MAALLIACTGLFYEKARDKRRAKKANKLEMEKDFDQLKAANAERQARISSTRNSSVSEATFDAKPPSYESLTHDGTRSIDYAARQAGLNDMSRSRSTDYTAADRVGTRNMAHA